jgi:hypothetical protein
MLELDHFLVKQGIDICLLTETHLRSGQVFRLVNYVCHRTDRRTEGGGTAILVRRGKDHYAIPVHGLTQLEETAIYVLLASGLVKILAAYLSFSRPLIDADLSACLSGGLPVLMVGDLNAKHVDWNSRLITTRGRRLRDYANDHSCLIYGPDTTTTIPYNSSATPDVLDIVITKDLAIPMYPTTCSALSTDHLTVLIDTRCRSSFLNLPDRPDFRKTDWVKFQACLEDRLPPTPKIRNGVEIDTCVREVSSAITETLAASALTRSPSDDPKPPIPARIQDDIRLKKISSVFQATTEPQFVRKTPLRQVECWRYFFAGVEMF